MCVCLFELNGFKNHTSNHREILRIPEKVFAIFHNPIVLLEWAPYKKLFVNAIPQ